MPEAFKDWQDDELEARYYAQCKREGAALIKRDREENERLALEAAREAKLDREFKKYLATVGPPRLGYGPYIGAAIAVGAAVGGLLAQCAH